jgi:hypothetical protein
MFYIFLQCFYIIGYRKPYMWLQTANQMIKLRQVLLWQDVGRNFLA